MTSELGQGTSAQIRLPLTLAIMAALIVEADGRPFAIPLDRIERTVRLADQAVRSVAGRRMLVLRDGVLPIVDASERYGGSPTRRRRVRGRRARRHRPLARRPSASSSASTSSSPARCPPRSPTAPPCPAPPSSSDGQIALIVDCDAVGRRTRPRLRLSKGTSVSQYTDLQLDALRELANIGSGTATTALSSMLGAAVDISVPDRARAADGRRRRRDRRPPRPRSPASCSASSATWPAPCCCSFTPQRRRRSCAACSASSPATELGAVRADARSATSSAPRTSTRSAR